MKKIHAPTDIPGAKRLVERRKKYWDDYVAKMYKTIEKLRQDQKKMVDADLKLTFESLIKSHYEFVRSGKKISQELDLILHRLDGKYTNLEVMIPKIRKDMKKSFAQFQKEGRK